MRKLSSFFAYLRRLHDGGLSSRDFPKYSEFLLKYSSKWLFLSTLLAFMMLLIVLIQAIFDFYEESENELTTIIPKFLRYCFLSIPSIGFLFYRFCKQSTESKRTRNTVFSVIFTSALIGYISTGLIEVSMRPNLTSFGAIVEVSESTMLAMGLYFVIWVLAHSSFVRLGLLMIHFIILSAVLSVCLEMKIGAIFKLLFSLLMISIVLIYYSGLREKQSLDAFSFNQKNEKIQEDWKNIIDYFPNGLALISPKKNVIFMNRTLIELLDLKSEIINVSEIGPREKGSNYINLVEKIGKIEEVFPNKDSFAEIINNFNRKKFSIQENAIVGTNNSNAEKRLGYSPVNISSRSFTYRPTFSNSMIFNPEFANTLQRPFNVEDEKNMNKKEGFETNEKKLSKNRRDNDSLKNQINKDILRKGTIKVDLASATVDLTLDVVINQMRRKTQNNDQNIKGNSLDENKQKEIRTFCTQFKNTANKNSRKFEVKVKPVVYQSKTVFMVLIQDISFMDLVQELRENNDYKNKVLTTLSHELRTPLNGAITPLEKLISEVRSNGQESLFFLQMNIAFKSLLLLQSVLNDVVDFALINSNQLYLNYEEMSFQRFLNETLDLFSSQSKEKGLDLILLYDIERKILKDFKTDFQRLRQILVSLINNALKNTFTGSIKVEVKLINEKIENSEKEYLEKMINSDSSSQSQISENNIGSNTFPKINLKKVGGTNILESEDKLKNKNDLKTEHHYLIRLRVVDTGVGIESSRLDNIKKSLSADDLLTVCTNLNRKNGCGLGLIISQCLSLLLGPKNSKGLEINSIEGCGTDVSLLLEGFIEESGSKSNDSLSIIDENKHESSNICGTFTMISKKSSLSCELIKKRKEQITLRSETSQLFLKTEEENLGLETMKKKSHSLMFKKAIDEEILDDLEHSEEKISNFLMEHSLIPHTGQLVKKNSEGSINNFIWFSNSPQLATYDAIYSDIQSHKSRKTCFCPEILIVDDDSFNILALETLLTKWCFPIIKAFNGQQAIDIIKERLTFKRCSNICGGVKMIFLDYHMPIKNGVEATREIREINGRNEFPPIIGCTAFGARDLVDDWKNAGMSDFLVKPIDSQKIERILKKWKAVI